MAAKSPIPDDVFIAAWREAGGMPSLVAKNLGLNVRGVFKRREKLAERGIVLETRLACGVAPKSQWSVSMPLKTSRHEYAIRNGVVMAASDCHYWPGEPTIAHRAFVRLVEELKPAIIILNGDVLDGATISRHDKDGWVQLPTVKQEIDACKERLGEIEDVAGGAALLWTLGNHDQRFERVLAMQAPQYEGLPGMTLPEHFPRWQFSMSIMLNPHEAFPCMVKHRHANGVHGAYNNVVKAGIHMVTGHLHRLTVSHWGDYRGRRYGIDTGTLADPFGPQFKYAEDAPAPHASGFAVLTFVDGDMLPPELVEVRGDHAWFRGDSVLQPRRKAA